MKYEIFTDYMTGNSFGNEDIKHESLEVVVEDVNVARVAVTHLEEHYKAVQLWENAPYASQTAKGESKEAMLERFSKEPWFPTPENPDSYWMWSCRLPVDTEGNTVNISLPYVGYFEQLHQVYAEPYEDTDGLSFKPGGW